MDKKKKITIFLLISSIILIIADLTLISAYLIYEKYGEVTLSPGEKYIVNIPFDIAKSPEICGTAKIQNGTRLEGIKVTVSYSGKNKTLGEEITDENGRYCIKLPTISEDEDYEIYLEYENELEGGELILASNDYSLDFDNILNQSKRINHSVELKGEIENEDAEVENGRIEITLNKCEGETTNCNQEIKKEIYYIDIESNENYEIPNSDLTFSWTISPETEIGKYKIDIEASFNAQKHTTNKYFHIVD